MSIELSTIPLCRNNQGLNGAPGIKLKITNKQGVESYLIGNQHTVDELSIKDPDIKKIIDKCSTLYTEMGTFGFISSSQGSIPEGNHQYQHIPYRYEYDVAFNLSAWCRKIPIISLDYSCRKEIFDLIRQEMRDQGPDEFEARLMKTRATFVQDSLGNEWKNGNYCCFEMIRKMHPNTESIERENHWAKTLVPHLQATSQPICIAVGAMHIVGDGLPEIFQKAGLKVEWIAPAQFRPSPTIWDRCTIAVSKAVKGVTPTLRSCL